MTFIYNQRQPNSQNTQIFEGSKYLGLIGEIEAKTPNNTFEFDMKFNDKQGNLGLYAIDNTVEPSIRFCRVSEINSSIISNSLRSATRASIDCDIEKLLKKNK